MVKNKIISEIERESSNELSPTELSQIEEHLTHVVDKLTKKSYKKMERLENRYVRSGKFPQKLENYFMTSKKENLPIKDIDRF